MPWPWVFGDTGTGTHPNFRKAFAVKCHEKLCKDQKDREKLSRLLVQLEPECLVLYRSV